MEQGCYHESDKKLLMQRVVLPVGHIGDAAQGEYFDDVQYEDPLDKRLDARPFLCWHILGVQCPVVIPVNGGNGESGSYVQSDTNTPQVSLWTHASYRRNRGDDIVDLEETRSQ